MHSSARPIPEFVGVNTIDKASFIDLGGLCDAKRGHQMTALSTATESIGGFLDSDRLRSRWRSTPWIMIGTLLIVLASIASSLSYTAREDSEVNREFAAKLTLYQDQAQRIGRFESLKHNETDLAAQAALDAALVDVVPPSRALAEVANALTAGVRLVDVSLSASAQYIGGGTAQLVGMETPGDVPANLLRIKGVALSNAQIWQFQSSLGKSAWLHGVNLAPSGGGQASGIGPRQFEMTAIFDKDAGAKRAAGR
jgi:Tfp pilus assembly protein PilN